MLSLLLVAAACAGSEPPPSTNEATDHIGPILEVERPISDAILYEESDSRLLHYARETLLQGCMETAGFDYPIQPYSHIPLPDRPYGITDLAEAEAWGYGLHPDTFFNRDDLVVNQYYNSLPAARQVEFENALYGAPDAPRQRIEIAIGTVETAAGCMGATEEALRPDHIRATQLGFTLQDLRRQALVQSESDARVISAMTAWSECMEQAGYDFETSRQANSSISHPPGQAPTQEEVTLAVHDVRCKHRADLVNTWAAVDAEIQHKLLLDHPGILEEYAESRRVYLDNARKVPRADTY